ncbi:hypothetical protein RND81_06G030900 [Saponaria officinalis]|uniref:Large ribosomal subunit protein bL25 beta domain-containing protein n=1 Tax=Saponaria officinalis TaxID=3572 RepID=A0AAW1K5T0_SAPOF
MNHWWRTTANKVAYTAAMSRNYHTIKAIPRELSGPRISARDRAQGRITAVVFTPPSSAVGLSEVSRKVMLTTESKQIQSLLKDVRPEFSNLAIESSMFGPGPGLRLFLTPEMSSQLRDPETGKMLNLVFAWADEGSHLVVDVPVVFKGDSCPGLQKGGQLKSIRTSLKYLCPAESIPQKIEVDVSNLDIGDKILQKDIKVDSTLKLLRRNDTKPICKIVDLEGETSEPLQA